MIIITIYGSNQFFKLYVIFWQELFFTLGSDTFPTHFYPFTGRKTLKHLFVMAYGLRNGMNGHGHSFCFTVPAVWSLPGKSSVLKTAGTFISCNMFFFGTDSGLLYPHPVLKNRTVLRIWIRIRIRRIHMFLGLPYPDPLVRDMDPDPSIIKQKQ